MKPLSDFYSRITPWVVGCPEPTINQALVDAAVRFCEDSKVIHQRTEPILTQANVSTYEVEVPTQQRVGTVLDVYCNGKPLRPLVGDARPNPSDRTGTPTHYYGVRTDSEFLVQLHPTPDAEYSVQVDASFVPTRTATSLEDELLERWVEAIVAGTLSKLFSIPNQPFSDPGQSAAAAVAFAGLSMRARREAGHTRVEGSDRIRPRRFI